MSQDINSKEFDEGTKLKLQIFRESFREWFPVFAYGKAARKLIIYDLFAGSGRDAAGNPGSPLILFDEAKGKDCCHCMSLCKKGNNRVIFAYNELEKNKQQALKTALQEEHKKCRASCFSDRCPFHFVCGNEDFQKIIQSEKFIEKMKSKDYAKFLLLDQYGFKHISEDVFKQIIQYPKTDFIFFITSSNIKRFVEHKAVQKYLHLNKLSFSDKKPKEVHKIITEYYRSLIPDGHEYYLHGFTIQKGANYWGLIFGSAHSYGMEKFLKACWSADPISGEANCDVNDEFGDLFVRSGVTVKTESVSRELEKKILSGRINSNIEGMKFVLRHGCMPKLYVSTVQQLIKSGLISIKGEFNRQATKIHTVDEYGIIVHENNKN